MITNLIYCNQGYFEKIVWLQQPPLAAFYSNPKYLAYFPQRDDIVSRVNDILFVSKLFATGTVVKSILQYLKSTGGTLTVSLIYFYFLQKYKS